MSDKKLLYFPITGKQTIQFSFPHQKYQKNVSEASARRITGTKPISHMFFIYGVKIEGQAEGPRIYGPIKQGSGYKRRPASISQLHAKLRRGGATDFSPKPR